MTAAEDQNVIGELRKDLAKERKNKMLTEHGVYTKQQRFQIPIRIQLKLKIT